MTSLTELPKGVSATEWTEEKDLWQDPRIRAFLVCIHVLDEVFESNYAILHCSPKRLEQIWEEIRKITAILKDEVAPLLKGRSKIPELEKARESADLYLEIIDNNLLRSIEAYPRELSEGARRGKQGTQCRKRGSILQDDYLPAQCKQTGPARRSPADRGGNRLPLSVTDPCPPLEGAVPRRVAYDRRCRGFARREGAGGRRSGPALRRARLCRSGDSGDRSGGGASAPRRLI